MGIRASKVQPEGKPQYWYRDNLLITTDKMYIDYKVMGETYGSNLMPWSKGISSSQMKKMLDNCLVISVLSVAETAEHMKKNGPPKPRSQGKDYKFAGSARIVTDYVSIAYLTDVFVLKEFQGRGLGSWMMRCIKEMMDTWPDLRGLMLMVGDKATAKMYERTLGVVEFDKGPSAGMAMYEMPGRAEIEATDGR